ncbi:MAG: 50S ribosomal protein L44e [Candidatus Micrarchaeota archaeon]
MAKIPAEIRTYCPKCRKHTKQSVKPASKGRNRTDAWGNRKHARKITGYTGKVAGEKSVRKQGKRQKLILTCSVCKKKQERVMGTRTKEKVEIKR